MSSSLELLTEQAWAVVLYNAGVTIPTSTADLNTVEVYPKLVIKSERGEELLSPQSGVFDIITTIDLEHKADDSLAADHATAWESILQSVYWTPPLAYQLSNAVAGLTVFGVKKAAPARHEFDVFARTWKKTGQWRLVCQPLALPSPPPPVMEIQFA